MAITRLAKLADLKEDELLQLNPAYKQGVTFDGPKHILVPADSAELLTAQLALIKPGEHMQWQQYRVNSGDSLSSIASRHQVPITQLKDINNLSNNRLNIGQVLNIPKSPGGVSSNLAQYTRPAPANKMYTVRRGDSLSQIAAQQKVSVTELKRWNKLSSNALKVGQNLKIQTSDTASRATLYKVRNGDSLYVIAKRHKVSLKQLKNWNPKISNALKPGQTLSLYL